MLVPLALAASLVGASPRAIRDSVGAVVRSETARTHAPGASVVVMRGERVAFAGGFGQANVEWSGPATERTSYVLMSVGKQFTAAAIMRLVERGIVHLDETLGHDLPDAPASWRDATVRQLLGHTSGIPDYVHAPDFMRSLPLDASPWDLIASVGQRPLEFPSGTRWAYSNTNYILLGLIVERASGLPFATFLREQLFEPLGMRSTSIDDPAELVPGRAPGYAWVAGALRNEGWVSPTRMWAAGGVISTAEDLGRWEAAVAGGRLLRRDSWRTMESPASLNGGGTAPYGMGNELDTDHGHRVAGHQGGALGYDATILRFPDDSLSVIVLINLRAGESRRLARRLATLWLPDLSDASRPAIVDPDPAVTARFRAVLEGAATGSVDSLSFDSRGRAQILPTIRRSGPRLVGALGALQRLTLIDRHDTPSGRALVYRADHVNGSMTWAIEVDADGKIAAMQPRD
jgi:CubicO group peptidase (beta-lactamase class C family)